MAASKTTTTRAARPVDKTLTKGLQLMEALSRSAGSRGISELAKELSLTKSNVHRLMQTLIASGYVRKDEATERYLLSSKLWRLSRLGQPLYGLREIVRPVLRVAVEKTSDSVLFAVVEGDEMLIVDHVETKSVVRVYFSMGQVIRVDEPVVPGKGLTALQMVALAYLSFGRTSEGVSKKRAVVNPWVSDGRLVQIRKDGFGVSRGSWLKDVNAVVVPVFDIDQKFVGVLSCFGPESRLTESRFAPIARILAQLALQIRDRLG